MAALSLPPTVPPPSRKPLIDAVAALTAALKGTSARLMALAEHRGVAWPLISAEWSPDRSELTTVCSFDHPQPWPDALGSPHLASSRRALVATGPQSAGAWLIDRCDVLGFVEVHGVDPKTIDARATPHLTQVTQALAAFWDEAVSPIAASGHAVFCRDLTPEYACPGALTVLTPPVLDAMRSKLRADTWPNAFLVGLLQVRAYRVDAIADHRVIVELAARLRLRPLLALSARQRHVADLVAEGHADATIAGFLAVSVATVKTHLRAIFKLVGVENRVALALMVKGC